MENQPIANSSNNFPVNSAPLTQSPIPSQTKVNLLIPMVLTVLVSAVIFGLGGYYLGRQSTRSANLPSSETQNPLATSVPTSATKSDWVSYTSAVGSYSLQYPKTWKFSDYNGIYQDHTTFNNQVNNPNEMSYEKPTNYIFGEIKVMTANAMRGESWKDLAQEEFFNPQSKFWLTGESIGGGPGFTQVLPQKITMAGYEGMEQTTHPSKRYEFVYPEQITKNYYLYFGGIPTNVLMISATYDSRASNVQDSLKEFDAILATLKLTTK